MRVSFIGAGNVATHLSAALTAAGHEVVGVLAATAASAETLARRCHCLAVTRMKDLPEADLYVFAAKDDALPGLVCEMADLHPAGLCVHTAGSVPMDIFRNRVKHYGVLYPLQTFSKQRQLAFREIPLFIEAHDNDDLQRLDTLARQLSGQVHVLSSEARKRLHLAAVFACNFSNHCFAIAAELLAEAQLPGELLNPLIRETCDKLAELPAAKAQTGPAVRYDRKVMEMQLGELGDDTLRKEIYRAMSESIHDYALRNSRKEE